MRASVASWAMARPRRRTEDRTVWIMGSPRSGSTWLLNLLHLLVGGTKVDEPLIGAHLAASLDSVTGVPDPDQRTVLDASADRPDYVFAAAASSAWRPALRSLVLDRFAYAAGGHRSQGPILVKEPNGSRAAPLLMSILPRARLLFLIRDGRDVVDSVLDGVSGGWMTEAHGVTVDGPELRQQVLRSRAEHWVASTEAVRTAFEAHAPDLRLQVTYEQVRHDPSTELERILLWLGRDDVLDLVPDAVRRLDFDAIPVDHRGSGRFARAATPGLWRRRFPPGEQALLEQVMGSTLTRLGYEVGGRSDDLSSARP